MDRWKCPDCGREFGRSGQSHTCNPGLTIDEYFATTKEWERPIFDLVAEHLEGLGDVIIDPIGVGILFKNGPTFCSLRTMTRWTALGFSLSRKLTSDRLSRKVASERNKHYHVINISDAAQIDEQVLDWLAEAYHTAAGTLDLFESRLEGASDDGHQGSGPGDGLMVPDDVDDPFA